MLRFIKVKVLGKINCGDLCVWDNGKVKAAMDTPKANSQAYEDIQGKEAIIDETGRLINVER